MATSRSVVDKDAKIETKRHFVKFSFFQHMERLFAFKKKKNVIFIIFIKIVNIFVTFL